MIYIGVDPGKAGAFAIIDSYRRDPCVYPWDDQSFIEKMKIVTMMQEHGEPAKFVAAVEKVGARPGQGTVSMFSFGQSYGFILGVLSAFGIGYQLVPPATWKREYGILKAGKQGSVEVCKRLFPGVSLKPTERSRKDSDGLADALCICEYARRHF